MWMEYDQALAHRDELIALAASTRPAGALRRDVPRRTAGSWLRWRGRRVPASASRGAVGGGVYCHRAAAGVSLGLRSAS